ncbi:MAG: Nudix family hydrolase [Gammaproteobacteria bacterium]|nr:Nudix family hydrolase [Gammaproteobacteria bacterium]MDH5692318.1 Nudix family hydrolase [Gammaproteobacteria bacterium]
MSKAVHVVAAVIYDKAERIFVAKRPAHLHQGGLWEFPGGKVEAGEVPTQALARELKEEIGIQIEACQPLIQIHHDYPDKSVFLDIFSVTRFQGEPHGREGQETQWVKKDLLQNLSFPEANWPIMKAVQLPQRLLITPEPENESSFLSALETAIKKNRLSLIQFRAKEMNLSDYIVLAHQVVELAHGQDCKVLLNGLPELLNEVAADGIHLNRENALRFEDRPIATNKILSMSCHNGLALRHAERLDCNFALLSPVLPTQSHPDAPPLGWDQFKTLAQTCKVPVYALGGMHEQVLFEAIGRGAQGYAAIRGLWGV